MTCPCGRTQYGPCDRCPTSGQNFGYSQEIRDAHAQTPPALRELWATAIEREFELNSDILANGVPIPYTDEFKQGVAAGIWMTTFLLRGGEK